MSIQKIQLSVKPDHLRGGYEFEIEPNCKCGLLKKAFEADVIFVSNNINGDYNECYSYLLDKDGYIWQSSGTTLNYCPWCGEKVKVLKKYK